MSLNTCLIKQLNLYQARKYWTAPRLRYLATTNASMVIIFNNIFHMVIQMDSVYVAVLVYVIS